MPDVAIELAAAIGQSLPDAYLAFLDGLAARPTLGDGFGVILDFDGRHWRPHSRDALAEMMQYDRGPKHPRAHETAAVAESLRDSDAKHDGEMSAVLVEQGFTLERLARGFCIGDDGNGEPLFIDPDTGAVFAYYHDGMDVEQWSESAIELIEGSRDWTGDDEAE